jgi:pyruvate formate lyase activating enzyme
MPFHQLGEYKYQQLGLKYEYADVAGLREEELEPFAKLLRESGFQVQIGG